MRMRLAGREGGHCPCRPGAHSPVVVADTPAVRAEACGADGARRQTLALSAQGLFGEALQCTGAEGFVAVGGVEGSPVFSIGLAPWNVRCTLVGGQRFACCGGLGAPEKE